MSEETTQTPGNATVAASNTAGEAGGGRKGNRGSSAPDANLSAMTGEKIRGKRRRRVSYLTINKIQSVDYKDVNLLRRFINDRGKILSAKVTGNTASQQRMIASAIRQAREMALLPFVVTEMAAERPMRSRGPRGEGGYEPRAPREAVSAPEAPAAEAPTAATEE